MELQQVRYVVAVAETGGFTAAARRLHVVQSALSHQIAALERELGFPLFARTTRRVELTDAGRAFLPAAKDVLAQAARAIEEAAAAIGEVRGTLRIGVIPTVAAIDLPAVLRRYVDAHPAVRVRLEVDGSDAIVEGVRSGALDVGLLGLPPHDRPQDVAQHELGGDRHVALLAIGHRWADAAHVSLAQLAAEPFVDFPAGSGGRRQTDAAFEAFALQRDVVFEALSLELIVGLVAADLGVALVPSAVAPRREDILVVPVVDGPTRVEHVIWSGFNPSAAAVAFVDLCTSRIRT